MSCSFNSVSGRFGKMRAIFLLQDDALNSNVINKIALNIFEKIIVKEHFALSEKPQIDQREANKQTNLVPNQFETLDHVDKRRY